MSRLNYLTEEELALDGINEELNTLERLCAQGHLVSDEHARILSGYRDRIASMLPCSRMPVQQDVQVSCDAPPPSCASPPPRLGKPAEQEADALQASIRQCFGRGGIN